MRIISIHRHNGFTVRCCVYLYSVKLDWEIGRYCQIHGFYHRILICTDCVITKELCISHRGLNVVQVLVSYKRYVTVILITLFGPLSLYYSCPKIPSSSSSSTVSCSSTISDTWIKSSSVISAVYCFYFNFRTSVFNYSSECFWLAKWSSSPHTM